MVDAGRLRLMTKAEMIKRQNRRELFTRKHFFGGDFVIFGLVKSVIGATLAYVLLIGIIFLSQADEILVDMNLSQLLGLAFNYINIYVLIMIATILLALLQHMKIYHKTGKSVREYKATLKALDELNGELKL